MNDTSRRALPVAPSRGPRRGIGLDQMRLTGGFWWRRQRTNARATLGHCLEWMERLGWVANFDRVAQGRTGGDRPGWQFSDSEVYKLMEALAWEYGRTGDDRANAHLEALVDRIAAAQDDDGYLNTCYGHTGQPGRYSDLSEGHELYCTGHLLQAAVARARTVGEDKLVEVARRAADHVCRVFAAEGLCGHPEIEVGLAELGRALGEDRYVEQARVFVERRGHGTLEPPALLDSTYFQDDLPVREAGVWRGHAVRALYLAAGAVDVAVETGDAELLRAVERQWDRTVERRTYLTGGMGSRHQDEGFGEDWELPPDRAYCETCAAVASVMVSWRLYLATGAVRYADLIERTMFNVVAASPSEDGRSFFYANPLHQRSAAQVRPGEVNPRAEGGARAPWFDVSCCPSNLARTFASWQAYAASVEGDTLTLLQYAASDLWVRLDSGRELAVRVATDYPDDGRIRIEVLEAPDHEIELRLRVPHWADGARLTDTGGRRPVAPGWASARGRFEPGATVVLDLPVGPRLTWPDERVDAVRGCVAVERGPLVLCAESVDLPESWPIESVRVDASRPPRPAGDGAAVHMARVPAPPRERGRIPFGPNRTGLPGPGASREVRLIPYHRWARRGDSTMRVFLPAG